MCSDTPKMRIFNQQTDMDIESKEAQELIQQILSLPDLTLWISASNMSEYEKECNPGWESREGYLKKRDLKECWAEYWSKATQQHKDVFLKFRYFDAKVFEEITGIKV